MEGESVEDAAADEILLRGPQHPGGGSVGELDPPAEIQRAQPVTQGIDHGAQAVLLLVGARCAAPFECLVDILHLLRGDLQRAFQ